MSDDRRCPDCSGQNLRRFVSGGFHYLKCKGCGRVFSAPPNEPRDTNEILNERMVMTDTGPRIVREAATATLVNAGMGVLEHERGYRKG